jgi:hypothetical protein
MSCNMWKVYTRPTCASDFFLIRLSGFLKNPDIFKCVEELKFCMNEFFKNVFWYFEKFSLVFSEKKIASSQCV